MFLFPFLSIDDDKEFDEKEIVILFNNKKTQKTRTIENKENLCLFLLKLLFKPTVFRKKKEFSRENSCKLSNINKSIIFLPKNQYLLILEKGNPWFSSKNKRKFVFPPKKINKI